MTVEPIRNHIKHCKKQWKSDYTCQRSVPGEPKGRTEHGQPVFRNKESRLCSETIFFICFRRMSRIAHRTCTIWPACGASSDYFLRRFSVASVPANPHVSSIAISFSSLRTWPRVTCAQDSEVVKDQNLRAIAHYLGLHNSKSNIEESQI